MPRGYNNYSFVIDSNFQPFTMQEMLTPFVMYKDAFDQAEAAYTDLSDKADTFKYLSDTLPEGSRAKEIYDGYANYLHEQAQDFAKHGLNMGNRRALTDLKRRYQGEIGRLSKADEALRQERELRRKLAAQDSSILYADDNLTIDSFLDNETPNLYSISGNELYTKGAAAGKAASSRVYGAEDTGSTLGGYYRDYVQRMGYNADTIAKFRQDMSTIPELQMAADAILEANGVTSNLTGVNLDRARQQVINGMIDGAVYTESHNPTRDLGKMTASEQAAESRAERQYREITKPTFDMQKQDWEDKRKLTYTFDENGNVTGLNPDYISSDYEVDPNTGKLKKKSKSSTSAEDKAEEKAGNSKQAALLKLTMADLAHNKGFDVTFGNDRQHYDYAGAMSRHKGQWKSGAIGDDVPGHGWGMFSSSNVESAWGNYSAEGSDSKEMRVLSPSELQDLLVRDPSIMDEIDKQVTDYRKKHGYADNVDFDIQLVEVPNEKDSNKKGYLIGIR